MDSMFELRGKQGFGKNQEQTEHNQATNGR